MTKHDPGPVSVVFRVEPEVLERIDNLAHYCGRNRSQWLRLAIARTDALQTGAELDRIERERGHLTEHEQKWREEVARSAAELDAALQPAVMRLSPN